jgi:hypothetical protein
MFREWSFRGQGVLIDWLYARGVQRYMFFLELLARVWPLAFQAIFRCECGRHNTFFLFGPPEEEEGSPADDPDWWRPTFDEIGEIIGGVRCPLSLSDRVCALSDPCSFYGIVLDEPQKGYSIEDG